MKDLSELIRVGAIEDIPKQGAKRFSFNGRAIAIVRTFEDQIYALNDNCPHKKGPLSEGIVHGRSITCPLHNWVFDLSCGEAKFPDSGFLLCYETFIIDDSIYLKAPTHEL